jgi:hypothetical protein
MIANSLRPNGAWISLWDLQQSPASITIADKNFQCGAPLAVSPKNNENLMHNICFKSGKMTDEDTALFIDHADVRTTVNDYCTALGFRSAEVRALPTLFSEKPGLAETRCSVEDGNGERTEISYFSSRFSSLDGNPLTGEPVDMATSAPLFGADIDVLAGAELLDKCRQSRHDFAFIMRG